MYRIALGPLEFLWPLAAVLGLTALITGSQLLRTLWANPTEALRAE